MAKHKHQKSQAHAPAPVQAANPVAAAVAPLAPADQANPQFTWPTGEIGQAGGGEVAPNGGSTELVVAEHSPESGAVAPPAPGTTPPENTESPADQPPEEEEGEKEEEDDGRPPFPRRYRFTNNTRMHFEVPAAGVIPPKNSGSQK